MNRNRCLFLLGLLVYLVLPGRGQALTLRYGLVVGSNHGMDQSGREPFPALLHAESEASRLRQRLVEWAHFDSNPQRTLLLLGPTRAAFTEAFEILANQKKEDRRSLGPFDSLFVLYFTGHGTSGQLLLQDGPLAAEELGRLIQSLQADFAISIFDACFSGSFDRVALGQKGVKPSGGLNLFRELPQEVLTAEGNVWIVSSGSDQVSYEDRAIGGVFTHFFTEALKQAPVEGPGITLERIWNYAREHTVAYTAKRGQTQTPQQFIARLKITGPLFFSFPAERSATLELAAPVQGRFLLSYADGQLTETIEKPAGQALKIPVYPGRAQLRLIKDQEAYLEEELLFAAGESVVLQTGPEPASSPRLGHASERLWAKGQGPLQITAVSNHPSSSLGLSLSYQASALTPGALAPGQAASLGLRWDRATWSASLRLGTSWKNQDYGDWSYRSLGGFGELRGGLAWDLGRLRLGVGGGLATGWVTQDFDTGSDHTSAWWQPYAWSSLAYPNNSWIMAEISLLGGAVRSSGEGRNSETLWQPRGAIEVGVLFWVW